MGYHENDHRDILVDQMHYINLYGVWELRRVGTGKSGD